MNVRKSVPLASIKPDPNQPRKSFPPAEQATLATSLKTHGQLVPILAWHDPALGGYFIIDGNRRLLAAQDARLATLEVEIVPRPDDATILQHQVTCNEARTGLSHHEKMLAVKRLRLLNPDLKDKEIAARLAIHKADVSMYGAYDLVPPEVQALFEAGKVGLQALYYISQAKADAQRELADAIAGNTLTVAGLRERIYQQRPKQERAPRPGKKSVKVGKVAITCESLDDVIAMAERIAQMKGSVTTLEELEKRLRA